MRLAVLLNNLKAMSLSKGVEHGRTHHPVDGRKTTAG